VKSATSTLHGKWMATYTTSSDRKLKSNIRPLYEALSDFRRQQKAAKMSVLGEDVPEQARRPRTTEEQLEDAVEVLRELRPVSYTMRNNTESKRTMFGFVAQEIEEVFPNLVMTQPDGRKALHLMDMIAVITMALQHRVTVHDARELSLGHIERTIDTQDTHFEDYSLRIAQLESKLRALQERKRIRKIERAAQKNNMLATTTNTTTTDALEMSTNLYFNNSERQELEEEFTTTTTNVNNSTRTIVKKQHEQQQQPESLPPDNNNNNRRHQNKQATDNNNKSATATTTTTATTTNTLTTNNSQQQQQKKPKVKQQQTNNNKKKKAGQKARTRRNTDGTTTTKEGEQKQHNNNRKHKNSNNKKNKASATTTNTKHEQKKP